MKKLPKLQVVAYNPDDFLCQVCAYKSCLYESEGRKLLKNKIKETSKKMQICKKAKVNKKYSDMYNSFKLAYFLFTYTE